MLVMCSTQIGWETILVQGRPSSWLRALASYLGTFVAIVASEESTVVGAFREFRKRCGSSYGENNVREATATVSCTKQYSSVAPLVLAWKWARRMHFSVSL